MKILYVNVIELNQGWGAEWCMNKALRKNGAETITLDYRKHRGHLASKFLGIGDDFDAFLLQRGDDFPLRLAQAVKRPRFFWATELIHRRKDQDRMFDSGLFDHVFVRGENCRDALMRRRILKPEQISILLSGFDPDIFYPDPNVQKDIDVLFVGALKNRRKKIITELKKECNITVASAFGKEMATLMNRAKIVLNIHAEHYKDTETRVYEALGCGAFLITETLGAENPFINGEHLVEASTVAEMKHRIAFYLEHEAERKALAKKGLREALQKHTYDRRAKQILTTMSLYTQKNTARMSLALDRLVIREYGKREKIDYMRFVSQTFCSKLLLHLKSNILHLKL